MTALRQKVHSDKEESMKGEIFKYTLLLTWQMNHCEGEYIRNNSSKHWPMSAWVRVIMYVLVITEILKEEYQRAGIQQCSLKLFSLKQR